MIRVAYLVTDPVTAEHFLGGQLAYLRREGFDVHLVSAPGAALEKVARATGVTAHEVPLLREIRPLADLRALRRLGILLRALTPDVVHASTPKAGLLGTIAARRAGVAHRVYLVRGLRLETARGLKRRLLEAAERAAAAAATHVYCVSESLRERYRELGLNRGRDVEVLAGGSSHGVSMERFAPAREPAARLAARRALGVPAEAPVIGFVGRLTHDKGIRDLVAAFSRVVRPALANARLVLVGDFEAGDPVDVETRKRIETDAAIAVRPFIPDLAGEYAAFDVVAFPSYREGFPNVPLEAAACGLPVAGFRATGTIDAVVDGVTGTLVDPGDSDGLGAALVAYLDDEALRRSHGAAGRERAGRDFEPEAIDRAWSDAYREMVAGGDSRGR